MSPLFQKPKTPVEKLIKALGDIAGYNDKGASWSNHSADQIEAFRSKIQSEIDSLISEIGSANFSKDLLMKLKSGAAVKDGSGDIYTQARAELLRS